METNLELAAVVLRRPDVSLGDRLVDMRSWLDNERIETIGFGITKDECEVRFKRPDDAHRFGQRFA